MFFMKVSIIVGSLLRRIITFGNNRSLWAIILRRREPTIKIATIGYLFAIKMT